jgi:hypothetical protein
VESVSRIHWPASQRRADAKQCPRVRAKGDQGTAGARSLGAAVLLGALVLGAPAVGALKTKEASTTVLFNTGGSVAAECKRGTKPLSGGFEDRVFEPGPGSRLYAYTSKKVGRNWETAGFNYGGGDATLVSYAYCQKGAKTKTRSASIDVDGFGPITGVGTTTARCKQDERAVSGGFEDPNFDTIHPPDGSRVIPFSSRKRGSRGWEVSAQNNSADSGTLLVRVYCAEGKRVKTRSNELELDLGETNSVVARCKRRERAISGGFAGEFDPSGTGPYVLTYGSQKLGARKWEVSGYNDGLEAATLTSYVYCRKR